MLKDTDCNNLSARTAYGIDKEVTGITVVKTEIVDTTTGRTVMTNYSQKNTASIIIRIAEKNFWGDRLSKSRCVVP